MDHWYLIQFKPNSDRVAERNLHRQGFETFLPREKITRRKVSRFISELKPLFPGYMFARINSDLAPWRAINSTMGVSRLVSFAGKPKPLPEELISGLMLRCDASGTLAPPSNLNQGDRVELVSGPFATFVATVDTIDPDQRIWVLVDFMGHRTRMQVTADKVKLAL